MRTRLRSCLTLCATALALTLTSVAAAAATGSSAGLVAKTTDPAPMFGITVAKLGRAGRTAAALAALPRRPTTRVYFGVHEPASVYAAAVHTFDGAGEVMGELLDSSDEKKISTEAFQARVRSFLAALGSDVDIWEVGNEVNGNWTGPYETVAAKLTEAWEDAHAADRRTANGADALRERVRTRKLRRRPFRADT